MASEIEVLQQMLGVLGTMQQTVAQQGTALKLLSEKVAALEEAVEVLEDEAGL